jgi:hypothetical protein
MEESKEHEISLLKVSIYIIIPIIVLLIVQILKPPNLTRTILLSSLIVIDFLIILRLEALILHLVHLQIATPIVSLKSLIPLDYFQLLKTGQKIEVNGDMNGVVVVIYRKGVKGEQHVS